MHRMGKHRENAVTTRARIAAWTVFISMAGTTMSFQVFHSLEHGHMPWPLAYLYGIVPLFISMLLIEFVSAWDAKWVRPIAYVITSGAMFLSASATGAVVLRAAPPHASLLFGLLLDGAAILAARFLMTGPAQAAEADRAARQAALNAAIATRHQAEGERDTALAEAAQAAQREAALRAELEAAQQDRAGKPQVHRPAATPKARPRRPEGESEEQKLGVQVDAMRILAEKPDISGSELGRRLGVQPGYGRKLKRTLAPAGSGSGS